MTFGIHFRDTERKGRHIRQYYELVSGFGWFYLIIMVTSAGWCANTIFNLMWAMYPDVKLQKHTCLESLTEKDVFELCG